MKLVFGKEIEDWEELERIEAVVYYNGRFYTSGTHQDAMLKICDEFWQKAGILNNAVVKKVVENCDSFSDYSKCIDYTDMLFRENKMFGFDLFGDENGNLILTAHYPQNLCNEKVYRAVHDYMEPRGIETLASFTGDCSCGIGSCMQIVLGAE
jgi:hypothetical protein